MAADAEHAGTVVLDPQVLRSAPAGADVVLEVATEDSMTALKKDDRDDRLAAH